MSGWDPSGKCCTLAGVNQIVFIAVAVISVGVLAHYYTASRGAFIIDIVWMTQALNDLRDRLFEWEVNADRTGAGKSDPHGCGEKSVKKYREQIKNKQDEIDKLKSEWPPKPGRDKDIKKLKDSIKKIRDAINKKLKGDTHHTKGQ